MGLEQIYFQLTEIHRNVHDYGISFRRFFPPCSTAATFLEYADFKHIRTRPKHKNGVITVFPQRSPLRLALVHIARARVAPLWLRRGYVYGVACLPRRGLFKSYIGLRDHWTLRAIQHSEESQPVSLAPPSPSPFPIRATTHPTNPLIGDVFVSSGMRAEYLTAITLCHRHALVVADGYFI
jgi:hypothetical protein